MTGTFRSDISSALRATKRSTYAWLGALRYAVYSHEPQQNEADDEKSHVAKTADAWYESLNASLEGAFKSAEGAIANEWQMQRDPRHNDEESEDRFAHKFEDNIGRIALALRTAEERIKDGEVLETRQMRDAMADMKTDLRRLLHLYEENLHELTESRSGSSLLQHRSWIVSGGLRL